MFLDIICSKKLGEQVFVLDMLAGTHQDKSIEV